MYIDISITVYRQYRFVLYEWKKSDFVNQIHGLREYPITAVSQSIKLSVTQSDSQSWKSQTAIFSSTRYVQSNSQALSISYSYRTF